ncbi:MAG: hypothetical protein GF408_08675 [Candidatus Omnitrophica bacterium]|nr:hypothetical protein [Candidatus Omnitrophota bacterium]
MTDLHIGLIGVVAGICTTISFVPQIIKMFRTKNVRDISLIMYVILTTGIFLWLVYGIFIEEFPIIFANLVGFLLCLSVIVMKIKYRKRF